MLRGEKLYVDFSTEEAYTRIRLAFYCPLSLFSKALTQPKSIRRKVASVVSSERDYGGQPSKVANIITVLLVIDILISCKLWFKHLTKRIKKKNVVSHDSQKHCLVPKKKFNPFFCCCDGFYFWLLFCLDFLIWPKQG